LAIEADKIPGLSERKESGGRSEPFADFKEREPEIARRFIQLRNTNGEGALGSIISFATGNGRLLGAEAGEWVGGLQYAPENGEQQLLLMIDVAGIEKWHDEILIVSGMGHMSINQGIIHKLITKNGKVGLEPWFVLPGSPAGMWTTQTNQLVIECFGGTMVFSTPQDFKCYSKPFEANPGDAANSDPFAEPTPPK
jgi:hypothetical protein